MTSFATWAGRTLRKRWAWLPALAAMIALGACATAPRAERTAQRVADYQAAAGADVRHFRLYGRLWSWETPGDDLLVVYTRPNQAWLLTVGGCTDLQSASAIGLTSRQDEVRLGLDRVLTGQRSFPCVISRIRPLDVARFKASQAGHAAPARHPPDDATGGD